MVGHHHHHHVDPEAWVKQVLRERFAITHSTLEMECSRHACVEEVVVGHQA